MGKHKRHHSRFLHDHGDHCAGDHGDHGDVDHGDDNAMAMKPVGGLGGVVRSRSQPLQNYHLAARHDPPQKFLSDPGVPGPIYGSSCLKQTEYTFCKLN